MLNRQDKNKTFALQLVGFFIFFSLFLFILMFIINTYMMHKVMLQNAEQYAKSLTSENINKIEGILTKIQHITRTSSYLLHSGLMVENQQPDYFRYQVDSIDEVAGIGIFYTPEYLKNHPSRNSVIYFNSETDFREKNLTAEADEYRIEDWFIIPAYKKEAYWSEPWIDRNISVDPITSYSLPLIEDNEVIGIVRTDISLRVLQRIVSSVRLHNTGYAILITSNGTYVTHPADSLILNYTIFSYSEQIKVKKLWEVGKEMVKGERGFIKLPYSQHYHARWIYYAPINLNKWSFGLKFTDRDIMADLNKVNLIFTLILGLGLLLLLVSIYTRITTLFKPLNALVKATNQIGRGDFDVKLPESGMNNEVSLLTESFTIMQSELKTYMDNLLKTNREKEKIAAEIKVAAQIQQAIIPSNQNLLFDIKEVSIYGILEPAEDIGGDLYDAFMIDDRFLCFAIADVFGKGIVASILMTMVQTLIRSQSKYTSSAVALVKELNSYLCKNNKQANFITIIIGILDLKTGVIEFCNAGHTPLYLKKANQQCIRFGETHSTALGIFEDLKVESTLLQMDAQDFLIMFTDGITEAMSDEELFFGLERMEDIISQMQNPTPQSIATAILEEVRNFTGERGQSDDLSILVLKFNHPRA